MDIEPVNLKNSAYAGVLSRDSVRIALKYADLNCLDVCACNIQNAYLQIPSSEKHFIICGTEFGLENVGKKALIIRALYLVKRAGADYWRRVQSTINEIGLESCKADPDIWFGSSIKDDGTYYYQYVLLYTENILAIMQNPEDFICHELGKRCVVKSNSFGPPTQYLGNKVSYITLYNGQSVWSFSSYHYVQDAVKNVIYTVYQYIRTLPKRGKYPWNSNYIPETDT